MQYDDFVGQVQHRAHLASSGQAVKAIHATLQTLAERLFGNEAEDLAAQLPQEVATYLHAQQNEAFSVDEFFNRIADREHVDLPDAVHHARAVLTVLQQAVSPGEIADVCAQLPEEYLPLFTSGSEGRLQQSD